MISRGLFFLPCLLLGVSTLLAASFPPPVEGDYLAPEFAFDDGGKLADMRLHYRMIGTPARDGLGVVTNAVLLLHGTTGSGAGFLSEDFGGRLFTAGGLLDASKYCIVMTAAIGHGKSAKPSDGLRGKFPRYGYRDMVRAQERLLVDGLKINHLRLVIGTSMGGMHTWLWAGMFPEFIDAAMPLGSVPERISGRNRVWRKMIIDSIQTDPEWRNGDYASQPHGLRGALQMLYLMSSNPSLRREEAPDIAKADQLLNEFVEQGLRRMDANDVLYALDACRDYDPGPALGKIKATVLAVNFADDLINPPELGVLEREIQKVRQGRAVVMPASPQTRGHGTIMVPAVWDRYLRELLDGPPSAR